ncbi:MAG: hypothetical protein SF069_06040 [Phycisphaerae bacterium]|nr:hypothetical protein [Phycisphaerae bacterium]
MNEHDHNEDAILDRNLREIAAKLTLPVRPGAAQRESWRSGERSMQRGNDADALTNPKHHPALRSESRGGLMQTKGDRRMARFRLFTVGTAAASVAIGAFLIGNGGPQTVHAATILREFRTGTWRAVQITIKDVDVDGIRVNGEMEVGFCEPISISEIIRTAREGDLAEIPEPKFDAAYFDLSVVAGPGAEADVVGLNLAVRGGVTAIDTPWVYLRAESFPDEIMNEHPEVRLILQMFSRGIMLDQIPIEGDITEALRDMSFDFGDDDEAAAPAAADNASAQLQVSARVGADGAQAAAEIANAKAELAGVQAEIQREIRIEMDRAKIEAEVNAAADPPTAEDDAKQEAMQKMLLDLLSGEATPEQLDEIAEMIQAEAGHVSVSQRDDGTYVLIARDIDKEDEMMKNAVVEIAYRQGEGVESLRVVGFGPANGEILIRFSDLPAARAVSVRQEMIDGGVQRASVQELMKMAEGMMKQAETK